MKCVLSTFIMLLGAWQGRAQSGYAISYSYIPPPELVRSSAVPLKPSANKIMLIVTDSISNFYVMVNGANPLRKQQARYGSKVLPHGTFHTWSPDTMHTTIGAVIKKRSYLIPVDRVRRQWTLSNETKDILGYNCKTATFITGEGDSIVARYTDELKMRGAPLYEYFDVPGIVLEVHDQKRKIVLRADKITPGFYPIVFPNIPILTIEAHNKLWKKM